MRTIPSFSSGEHEQRLLGFAAEGQSAKSGPEEVNVFTKGFDAINAPTQREGEEVTERTLPTAARVAKEIAEKDARELRSNVDAAEKGASAGGSAAGVLEEKDVSDKKDELGQVLGKPKQFLNKLRNANAGVEDKQETPPGEREIAIKQYTASVLLETMGDDFYEIGTFNTSDSGEWKWKITPKGRQALEKVCKEHNLKMPELSKAKRNSGDEHEKTHVFQIDPDSMRAFIVEANEKVPSTAEVSHEREELTNAYANSRLFELLDQRNTTVGVGGVQTMPDASGYRLTDETYDALKKIAKEKRVQMPKTGKTPNIVRGISAVRGLAGDSYPVFIRERDMVALINEIEQATAKDPTNAEINRRREEQLHVLEDSRLFDLLEKRGTPLGLGGIQTMPDASGFRLSNETFGAIKKIATEMEIPMPRSGKTPNIVRGISAVRGLAGDSYPVFIRERDMVAFIMALQRKELKE
ncbi:hypothetical protein EXS65_02875 [Candidatus Peribacteria bacterium]|nr:hypothetical protein [Candidatus Peribacteria bacterium]